MNKLHIVVFEQAGNLECVMECSTTKLKDFVDAIVPNAESVRYSFSIKASDYVGDRQREMFKALMALAKVMGDMDFNLTDLLQGIVTTIIQRQAHDD